MTKYKFYDNEEGDFISLATNERVNLIWAEHVFSPNGWQNDGWIEFESYDEALAFYGIREITNKESELYKLYAEVYAETLSENSRILSLQNEIIRNSK